MIEIDNKPICMKEIANMYNIGIGFFRTMLCRSEFNKYRYAGNRFKNCYGLHKDIKEVILLKQQTSCSRIKNIKLPSWAIDINYSLN